MSQSMTERFDIYDEEGNPIGIASRGEVHTKGHWHHTFHCWLVRRDWEGKAYVLFQQRSDTKDTNPGCFDITAAGHLAAGETPKDAVREMEEELGLSVLFEELVPYGTIREEDAGEAGGKPYIDREVSHVFGLVTDRSPEKFTLQEEEVAGLYEADALRLIDVMEGIEQSVEAIGVEMKDGQPRQKSVTVRASDFVSRDCAYYIGVFRFLQKMAEQPGREQGLEG
jgi:isopentenyldiphosphate isomerase